MKRVLFVCTGNRARSQMAEGLLRRLAGDRYESHSAGTEPKGLAAGTVVCESARQVCPVFPGGGERIHWDVEDPLYAEERGASTIEALRAARDELRTRIEEWLEGAAG